MTTVAASVDRIVRGSSVLSEGLTTGILNLSAVARSIRRQVEAECGKKVAEGAVIMALSRLAPRLAVKASDPRRVARLVRDVTVRSNIIEYTFQNSGTLLACQRKLLVEAHGAGDPFVTFTQGAHEMTVMVNGDLDALVQKVFAGERRLARLPNLAAVGIHYTPKVVDLPGVYYSVLQRLMWGGINIVELVSTYTELALVLDKRDVDRAFAILTRHFWP
jgi:hypothetical protein